MILIYALLPLLSLITASNTTTAAAAAAADTNISPSSAVTGEPYADETIVVPLSTIDSILPFDSYKSNTYSPPAASVSNSEHSINSNTVPAAYGAMHHQPKKHNKSKSKESEAFASSFQQFQDMLRKSVSEEADDATLDEMNVPTAEEASVMKKSPIEANNNPLKYPQLASTRRPTRGSPLNKDAPTAVTILFNGTDRFRMDFFARPNGMQRAAARGRMKGCYRNNRKVPFSQYWIPKENEWDENNDGKRVYLGGSIKKSLLDVNNRVLGQVPVDMWDKCRMEGTCLLENGDLINLENTTKTFIKVGGLGRRHNVFGLGSGKQNLVPYVSVAANDLPYGQKLYIPKLDGVDLGGGLKHNGCVRVDDVSWSFNACQVDFFVPTYVDYLWLNLEEKMSIRFANNCKLKNYITTEHLAMVKASTDEGIIPSLMTDSYDKPH